MIAALIQCAIALAISLVVASLPFGSAGRPLRHAGFAIFFGVFALAIVFDMVRVIGPVMLTDWRFYVFLLIASPIAYLILQVRRQVGKRDGAASARPNPPKRRHGEPPQDRRGDDSDQAF